MAVMSESGKTFEGHLKPPQAIAGSEHPQIRRGHQPKPDFHLGVSAKRWSPSRGEILLSPVTGHSVLVADRQLPVFQCEGLGPPLHFGSVRFATLFDRPTASPRSPPRLGPVTYFSRISLIGGL
jgi:hypothetical protein